MRLTQKQETFCLKYHELGNAAEAARLAKYSPKTADVIGWENLGKPQIQARIDELRKKAENASQANVLERKQILSDIARGKLPQLTIEKVAGTTTKTTARQRDPIQAIAELNKMEGVYPPQEITGRDGEPLVPQSLLLFQLPDGRVVGPTALLDSGNGHKDEAIPEED